MYARVVCVYRLLISSLAVQWKSYLMATDSYLFSLLPDDKRPGVFRDVCFLQLFEYGLKNSLHRGNRHKANLNG